MLERRPDVAEAEQFLVAANADIGVAKAMFFPTISLTGFLGGVSGDLTTFLGGSGGIWSVGAGLLQPIYQGGPSAPEQRGRCRRDSTQALAKYQKAALNGYREVADSLVTIQKLAEERVQREAGVAVLVDAADLARARYDSGLASYIEILTADQDLFEQQLRLAQTRGRGVPGARRALSGARRRMAATTVDRAMDGRVDGEAGKAQGRYAKELIKLQGELCLLQEWVKAKGLRVIIIFEGRDAAGKGGTIKAITERVSPRVFRLVALPAPSDREKSQMYMQRYMAHFPAAGEIVIFDRSWYNRAGVEHVMGFCTEGTVRALSRAVSGVRRDTWSRTPESS